MLGVSLALRVILVVEVTVSLDDPVFVEVPDTLGVLDKLAEGVALGVTVKLEVEVALELWVGD